MNVAQSNAQLGVQGGEQEERRKACTSVINQSGAKDWNSKILNTLQTRQVDTGRWKGGKVERWKGGKVGRWKGVQLERNADCKCQLKANAGRGGRGYGELTRVSRTYLRCQSKSQPGNLSRRVDVAATVTMVTLKLPCWFRHGANSLRDFGRTQSKLLG